ARGTERHRRRRLRQERHAHHRAALLIDRDQAACTEHARKFADERAYFRLVAQILSKQNHRSDAVAAQERALVRLERLAADADHPQLAGMELGAHLTAPSMPRMKNRCVKKKTTSAGAMVRIAPAAITRVELPKVPESSRMPTASGISSLLVSTTLGHR